MKMRAKSVGMTLIECMIYLVILSWLILLVVQGGYQYMYVLKRLNQRTVMTADFCITTDILARDLSHATAENPLVRTENDHLIFMVAPDHMIGWELIDGAFVRYDGIYDIAQKQWSSATRSRVLDGLTRFTVRLESIDQQSQIYALKIILIGLIDKRESSFERTIFLPNGSLV